MCRSALIPDVFFFAKHCLIQRSFSMILLFYGGNIGKMKVPLGLPFLTHGNIFTNTMLI